MDFREFLGYALGTAFVLAVTAALAGAVVLMISAIPLMLLLFPITAGIIGAVLLVGWFRHRRRRRASRR